MFGSGVVRGMGITLKAFFDSYKADLRRGLGKRYLPNRQAVVQEPSPGYITIQYPEEKLAVPENFRFFPVLIRESQTGEDLCTACGICARVCPPQCIWIVRAKKSDGKPEPKAEQFWIDTSICMQCGYCAEYCPFDAIKMDHRFELASEERWDTWIHDMERLTVTTDYYAKTHPRAWAVEDAA
ncbi:MAG: 4Fe-4S binding protein, partial [Chloroflexi bacterium]|nr:4Fe-4S binding protein [Chloroflexota bacterium]